jgi:hypothetical protein
MENANKVLKRVDRSTLRASQKHSRRPMMVGGGRYYPGVTHDDIIACLAYARDTLSSEKVFPSPA